MRRVLVVDDHGPWRRQICSMLRSNRSWQVAGESADGLSAVAMADALRPDLILLDVGLPALNGIEAARRILALNPQSRILFVTAHRSWDVAEAALGTGARGYVLKADAGRELLPAMTAIVAGRRFISGALTGRPVAAAFDHRDDHRPRCHEAGFYSEDLYVQEAFARFAADSLAAGKAVIVIAGESRQQAVDRMLRARGVDVDLAIRDGLLLPRDVNAALAAFTVDGWPDEERLWKAATSLFMQAARAARGPDARVAGCGEGTHVLWKTGRGDAALRLEQLWDEVARTCDVDTFCAYSMNAPHHDKDSDVFRSICEVHSAVHSR